MSLIAALLLTTSLNLPADVTTLVLRSGERISVDGPIRQENGRIVFKTAGGALYSIAAADVDVAKTRGGAPQAVKTQPDNSTRLKLRVTEAERERLLRDLERNHAGQPAREQILLSQPPEPPSREQVAATANEEWQWRLRARGYEEGIRRAKENLQLLENRIAELRSRIAGFISLGYRPAQFTYDTAVLQTTEEQLPYAELELTRAQRDYEQFRDDARRIGILPGWLR